MRIDSTSPDYITESSYTIRNCGISYIVKGVGEAGTPGVVNESLPCLYHPVTRPGS